MGRKRGKKPKVQADAAESGSESSESGRRVRKNPKQQQSDLTSNSQTTTTCKTKPIFVTTTFQIALDLIKNLQLNARPLVKIISGSLVSIQAAELSSKAAIIKALKEHNIQHHTFTEKAERKPSFVLKGFYKTSKEDLMKILTDNQVPVTGVSIISNKEDFPIYLVHFQQGTTIQVLNRQFKVFDYLLVRWEVVKPAKRRHTQCGRCKRWGHSSANCGHTFRCIKCTENHEEGQCKRTSKDNNELSRVACVNCGGEHPANSLSCPTFQQYIKNINKKHKHIVVPKTTPKSEPQIIESWPEIPNVSSESRNQPQPDKATIAKPSYADKVISSNKSQKPSVGSKNPTGIIAPPSLQSKDPFLIEAIRKLNKVFAEQLNSLNQSFLAICKELENCTD